ncbi:hypothetical protein ATCC90586_005487 [Pythium insidiosum]|nr:hypothetical protein ATCC90586_005487 [Pythium insidiosum]
MVPATNGIMRQPMPPERWGDENDRQNGPSADDLPVGTHASFEQILARELAKQARAGDDAASARAREKKPFLRKGARGWWMENPGARQKMQKHVLTSADEGHQAHELRRHDGPSSGASNSRKETHPEQRRARRENAEDQRSNSSVETLGMSGIRRDFKARIEREADELADFEALERELAAEKESFLREQQIESDMNEHTDAVRGDAMLEWSTRLTDSADDLDGSVRMGLGDGDLGKGIDRAFEDEDHISDVLESYKVNGERDNHKS